MKRPPPDSKPEPPARSRIVRHARSHFFAHGFRSVTMDDLADALAMSKKTLYAHFSSKHALLEAAIADKFAELQTDLDGITADRAASFTARLQQLLECLQSHLDEVQPPFVRDMRRESPELFARIEGRRQALIQLHFEKLFNEGRRCGLVRKDIPPNVIIEVLLGAMQGIMNPAKIEELGLSPRNAFMAIIKVVTEGAMTPKAKS
jgi:AcrR family transcriptional regulator